MPISRKSFLEAVREVVLFILVSLLQTWMVCNSCTNRQFIYLAVFTFCMWVVLWRGNSTLSHYISKRIPWIRFPGKRLVAGIFVSLGYTVLAVLALLEIFEFTSDIDMGKGSLYTVYGAVVFTVLISLFLQGREFLSSWRKAAFEKERLEKENIVARYESLKSQVSPHFLFNSLNALTNLVYEDPDKAANFIKQLAAVYRYVLDSRDKEVVPLSEELTFLDSYLYLQRIRFGEKLIVTIDQLPSDGNVAPLALQMLVENAIKHNIISEADPLTVRLYAKDGFLLVENNLQKKRIGAEEGSVGVGLDNICRRYEFLSNTKVNIIQTDKTFTVTLPILNGHPDH